MTPSLLDVDVLLALLDPDHQDHHRAHRWAQEGLAAGWATCAVTENGFVRILSQPSYPNLVAIDQAISLLRRATSHPQHQFWPCDLSVTGAAFDTGHLLGHRQLTDTYLLGLAVHHHGAFLTLDRHVDLATVPGATPEHLVLI